MKGASIISAIHHLKLSAEYMADFEREHAGSKGEQLFRNYRKKVEWIPNDIITHPALPETVRTGIKNEWNSDVFALMAINEKLHLLSPEQREAIELVIDRCLSGDSLKVEQV